MSDLKIPHKLSGSKNHQNIQVLYDKGFAPPMIERLIAIFNGKAVIGNPSGFILDVL